MGVKLTKKAAPVAQVSTELKNNGKVMAENHSQETPPWEGEAASEDPWCQVAFGASFTKNMGNHESLKVGVDLTIPCRHCEIDEVFEYAKKWVDERMKKCLEGAGG
jgi:hypothetical protein